MNSGCLISIDIFHALPVKVTLRKLAIYPYNYIRRLTGVTHTGESSKVDVLAGAGLAIQPGRSIMRILQPHCASHVRTDVRGVVGALAAYKSVKNV